MDPNGKKDTVKTTITKKSDDLWYVEYTALIPGLHSVNVNFGGKPTPKSPYAVGVSPGYYEFCLIFHCTKNHLISVSQLKVTKHACILFVVMQPYCTYDQIINVDIGLNIYKATRVTSNTAVQILDSTRCS